jgi:glycosyltransferase 2 family protein
VLSIAIHVLTVVISWCIVRSILAPAQFEQMFRLTPPVALITMAQVSIAGWGLREASRMLAFGYSALNRADGTMVSLLTGFRSSLAPSADSSGSQPEDGRHARSWNFRY